MLSPWLACPKPNPQARLRLFCFPYAGGGASTFRTWADDLPADIEVCPVQLPGRENRVREQLFTQLLPLVETLASALRPSLNTPFAFFGHSMGALISFELARQLRRQGAPEPIHLFVSSRPAPQLPDLEPIHQLPEAAFVTELWSRYNGLPEVLLHNSELMKLFLPVLQADFAIFETYVYTTEASLDCPISAFGGLQDSTVSQEDLLAWRHQTCKSFTLQMFSGDHFFLQDARTLLLQTVGEELMQQMSL